MHNTLEKIAQQLAAIGSPGSFATRCSLPIDDLHLKVKGVGNVRLPVSATMARKLCAAARPARHGFKDQTRLDKKVRDTWEIPKSRVSIDQRRWKKALGPALDGIRGKLGLPETCHLKAELHNLLIYAPRQFFVTHQDSEKADQMIGSLVVSLPSKFTGGSFVIEHHDQKRRIGGSDTRLTLIAFYADCRHEVRPITQGHRVVLTYNLIAEGGTAAAGSPEIRVDALAQCVSDYFKTPVPPHWSNDRKGQAPDRLVYLLDHEYTQRGLSWTRLKNADAARAAALQEVARQLDCEIFLALADVHETWACEDDGYGYRGHRWGWDENEPTSDADEHELIELIESGVELCHWIGSGRRRPRAITANVRDGELCYTKPSADYQPFRSEHEGYMGNWGNTVDRWYHRAAVVMWPRERDFVIRAKASAHWAMDEVAKSLKVGNAAQALKQVKDIRPFWSSIAMQEAKPGLPGKTMRVAAALGHAGTATSLLAPFSLKAVTPRVAPHFARLLDCYGIAWCRKLMRRWSSERKHFEIPTEQLKWLKTAFPALCRALCSGQGAEGPELARWLLDNRWSWMQTYLKGIHDYGGGRKQESELSHISESLQAMMESCRLAGHVELRDRMTAYLIAHFDELPTQVPLGLLRVAHRDQAPEVLGDLGLQPLHAHGAHVLTARLSAPARASDDWSIQTSLHCSCKLCTTLARFLRAPDQVRFEWPLAKARRQYVHGVIDSHDLPVRHDTRRTGSPYTLVLEKTRDLFKRAAAERRYWNDELKWLRKVSKHF